MSKQMMLMRYSPAYLLQIADKVLTCADDLTQDHIKIACESGFITYDFDCDGFRPVPTQEYIYWLDKANEEITK